MLPIIVDRGIVDGRETVLTHVDVQILNKDPYAIVIESSPEEDQRIKTLYRRWLRDQLDPNWGGEVK